jgi:hypothetical protein
MTGQEIHNDFDQGSDCLGLKSGVHGAASAKSRYVINHGRVWDIGSLQPNAWSSGSGWVQRDNNVYWGLGW